MEICKLERQFTKTKMYEIFQLTQTLLNLTFMELRIARCVFYITNEMQLKQCSLLLSALYMFRAVFPPNIRSL